MFFLIVIHSALSSAGIPLPADSLKISTGSPKTGHDAWFGKDKFDHLCSSAFLTGLGYYAAKKELDFSTPASRNISLGFSVSLGIGKELFDKISQKGSPSPKDLVADLLGTALALSLITLSSH